VNARQNERKSPFRGQVVTRTRWSFRELASDAEVVQLLESVCVELRECGYPGFETGSADEQLARLTEFMIRVCGGRTYSKRWIIGQTRQLARRIRERGCEAEHILRSRITYCYGTGSHIGAGSGNRMTRTRKVLD